MGLSRFMCCVVLEHTLRPLCLVDQVLEEALDMMGSIDLDIQATQDMEFIVYHSMKLEDLTLGQGVVHSTPYDVVAKQTFRDTDGHPVRLEDLFRAVNARPAGLVGR